VFAAVSVSSIVVSIVNFCTETIPVFAERPVCVNVTDADGRTRQVPVSVLRAAVNGSQSQVVCTAYLSNDSLERHANTM